MIRLDISKLKYVLFDWDNTLAETRPSLVWAVDKILAEYGLPCWEISKEKRNRNLSFKDNFPLVFGTHAAEAYEKYREVYKKIAAEKVRTFDKVKDVLSFLRQRNIGLIIMTNKERCLLEYELPLLFEPDIFSRIVCGHEAPADKPSGRHALYALEGLLPREEINRQTVWIVGDSPQDSASAMEIGALPVRVNKSIWGDVPDENMENIIRFNSFADFFEALKLAKN